MRLVAAELIKLRRRTATYVVLIFLLVLMLLTFVAMGDAAPMRFPDAYGLIGQFAFGLGSLFTLAYAAAIAGADWNWGVLRNVIARGESRAAYIIAKAIGLAIVVAIGVLIVVATGIALTYLLAVVNREPLPDVFRDGGPLDVGAWLGLGYVVLLQRAAIGFAVAVVVRSQLAGVVAGIGLYIGETIITAVGMTVSGLMSLVMRDELIGPEWFQYLPFQIGDAVLGATVAGGAATDLQSMFLRPVPFEHALPLVLAYLLAALLISVFVVQRREIVA
ncbi:MAG TPA: ABC transporter permease [Candidatus Limnocylindria bacterium]|nr:ABC transporter permease [Candidatus Limnocylindria bacterium]